MKVRFARLAAAFFAIISTVNFVSCTASLSNVRSPAEEAMAGPIHIYVWMATAEGDVPVPGARVFVLTADGREAISVLTDMEGLAQIPNAFDVASSKYVFAETEGMYLTGLPWFRGSREYDLPMRAIILVNRITVPVPHH